MSSNRKYRMFLMYIALGITILVLGQYIYCKKYNAYEVYMNGKKIAFIKSKEDIYKAKESIEDSLGKRFASVSLKDDISIEKVVMKPEYLDNMDSLKRAIIKNSSTSVPAALMKSDGQEIAFLANENEMKEALDYIKNSYKEKDKDGVFKLKNHITYINKEINIGQLSTIEEAANAAIKPKTPLIVFYKQGHSEEINNVSLSRSLPIANIMYNPSRGSITSTFGERWGKMHNGIDIASPMGTSIYAAMDGKVYCTEWEEGYGNIIKIGHGCNIQTFYAHCSKIDVTVNQYVKRGDKIGEVGSTGRSTGPHVHFEIRIDGVPQDPIKYLK